MNTINFLVNSQDKNKLELVSKLIQKRFDVTIFSPSSANNAEKGGYFLMGVKGSVENNTRAMNFLKQKVFPGVIRQFTYERKLKAMFKSYKWRDMMEQYCDVCIVNQTMNNRLLIIGPLSTIDFAIMSLNKLVKIVNAQSVQNKELVPTKTTLERATKLLKEQLDSIKQNIRNSNSHSGNAYPHEDSVIILNSSIEEENDSVILLAESEIDISVITISDDEESGDEAVHKELNNDVSNARIRPLEESYIQDSEMKFSIDNLFVPFVSKAKQTQENTVTKHMRGQKRKHSLSEKESNREDEVIVLSPDVKPPAKPQRKLRAVVIDGSNVAKLHGKRDGTYSCLGIQLCVEYFKKLGHTDITAFVPQFRRNRGNRNTTRHDILEKLEREGYVVFTPSRRLEGRSISCYDDRFIVKLAAEKEGVIVSNDNYRDLMNENREWKNVICQRLLMFCFVGDIFMVPDDPLGRLGPSIEEFLSFPSS